MDALVNKLRLYKGAVTALLHTHISYVETKLAEHVWGLEDKIEEDHQKLRKELKEGIYHILPESRGVSVIWTKCPSAKGRGYTP